MKKILVVDDEKLFLNSVKEGLSFYSEDFVVLTAENGNEAIKILEAEDIKLVITDIKMPDLDGFELLVFINNYFATIPVIAMTAFGTPELEQQTETLGALQYLEKPFHFEALAEKIFEGLALGSRGFEQSIISLPSFLELIESEEKTCTLKIRWGSKRGSFYFQSGKLVEIEAGRLRGLDAVSEIFKWPDPIITILNRCEKNPKDSIYFPVSKTISEFKDQADNVPAKKNRYTYFGV